MFTFAFVSGLMIAFVFGAVAGCNATAADRRETAELRAALNAKQSELEQNKQRYERRLAAAYETIAECDEIFDQLEQARFPAKTAVVIPFKGEYRNNSAINAFPAQNAGFGDDAAVLFSFERW